MNRVNAIKNIIKNHKNALFILSNGLTSREASFFCHNNQSLYLLHAMGEALPVGIGVACALPKLNVVVIEGDGNALMGGASWVMNKCENLDHYIIENSLYATTGNQELPKDIYWPSTSNVIRITDNNFVSTPNPPPPNEIIKSVMNWLKKNNF